jgi:hypothetical protein
MSMPVSSVGSSTVSPLPSFLLFPFRIGLYHSAALFETLTRAGICPGKAGTLPARAGFFLTWAGFLCTIPHLTLGEQQNGWNPLDKRVSAVALVFKMLYGVLYFKIFFSFLLSAFGS